MNNTVTVALAQLDLVVGDVKGNTTRIVESAKKARDELRADMVVFPELSICGYPPEDLLFHAGLRHAVEGSLEEIRASVRGIAVLVGFPEYRGDEIFNSCAVIADGEYRCHYRKRCLPNYAVFDEERYFTAGKSASVFKLNGIRIGLNICEDIWRQAPISASRAAGAEVIVAINGSPYQTSSQQNRERAAAARAGENSVPIVYLNMVGGQDELVFDGGSFAMTADGDIRFRAPPFEEGLYSVVLRGSGSGVEPGQGAVAEPLSLEASVYRALVTGTRDYVRKHGFPCQAASTRRW
jgi:NAD+ synthase (glutamine-hydrolysing)